MTEVSFYFDLGSPYAYLSAERLQAILPEPVQWRPLLLGGLFGLSGRSSWAQGDYRRRQAGMAEIEDRARRYGLPPVRWPDPWPSNYLEAMRATTYAFVVGRGREFTRQAFRDAFQRGRDLSIRAHVLDAGRAVGIGAAELERAITDTAVKLALRETTEKAYRRGVIGVPTVAVGEELFWGDDRLEEAATQISCSCGRATPSSSSRNSLRSSPPA
jgi:2-hydroxychromene-2-carboxylate isomerase